MPDGGKNRLRRALPEHARADPGGMDAVHREQAKIGIVDAAVVEIDDGSAVGGGDGADLRVEIRYRIPVLIHRGSAGIAVGVAPSPGECSSKWMRTDRAL